MPLDSTGLTVRRFEEILQDLINSEKSFIDPNIEDRDDELLGQINNIIALISSDMELLIQAGYDNMNPELAEGVWLDKLAAERSLTRLATTKSYTNYQRFTGTEGANIPSGTQLQNVISEDIYETTTDHSISTTSCENVTYSINTVLDSTLYYVTVNGVVCNFTSSGTASVTEIVDGLRDSINTAVGSICTASNVSDTLFITSDTTTHLNIAVIPLLTVNSCSILAKIEALEFGDKKASVGVISKLVSTLPAISSTTNIQEVVRGRLTETDEELRVRIASTSQNRGVATHGAISAALRNLNGVSSVTLLENDTTVTDTNGLPPHSISPVIVGGEDEDIALALLDNKAAGIPTYGTSSYTFIDDEGVNRTMYFTRPALFNIAVRVTYTTYTEETLTTGISEVIKQTVEDYVNNTLSIGEDVIPARFLRPLYGVTSGVDTFTVEVQQITNPGDPPVGGNWQTTKLAVSATEYAQTTDVDITVVAA